MMTMLRDLWLLVGISLLAIFIPPTAAIKCYTCRNCPYNMSLLVEREYDCNREDVHGGSSIFCMKVVRPDGFVDRMCGSKSALMAANEFGHSCDEFKTGKTRLLNKICFCQTDFCNGATTPVPIWLGMGIPLVLAVLMMLYLVRA